MREVLRSNNYAFYLFAENASFVRHYYRNIHFAAVSAVPGDINYLVLEYSRSLSGSETRAGFFQTQSLSAIHYCICAVFFCLSLSLL